MLPPGARPYAVLFLEDPIRDFGFTPAQIGDLRRAGHVLLRPLRITELGGASAIGTLREIPLEEFLPRQPIALDPEPVRALVEGRRVLVTGAGGSIGSEIARQLLALGCAELTLVDHSEYLLFEIDRELSRGASPVMFKPRRSGRLRISTRSSKASSDGGTGGCGSHSAGAACCRIGANSPAG